MENELFKYQKHALMGDIGGQPLCNDYKAAWRACGNNKEMLVRLALKQQSLPHFATACYKHLGLSKKYILKEFGEYINGKKVFENLDGVDGYTYELFVGHSGQVDVRCDVTSFMWTQSDIVIPKTKCPTFYVSNSSNIHITCEEYNSPLIYLFDDSTVTIYDADENSRITVFKYSGESQVITGKYCLGNVKIFNKELRL